MNWRRAVDLARAASSFPVKRPWLVLAAALVSLVPAIGASLRLPVRTSLTELLPESRPSVVEFRRVSHRLAGISTLIVVAESNETDRLERFVDELAPRLRGLGPRYVTGVDEGNREMRRFVEQHEYLYARLSDLQALRDDVVARYDYEVGKRSGLDLGISEEAPPPLSVDTFRARFDGAWNRTKGESGDDYHLAEHGHLASIVVRTPFESADPRAFELESRIRALAAECPSAQAAPKLRVFFTGNLVTSAEEHRSVTRDLAHVGTTGVLLILGVVFLFFMRARVLFALAVTIAVACFWAFAVAFVAVRSLNSATGFLVSIIAGNGINFGIVASARYLEARLRDGLPAHDAVTTAMRASAPGTLAAAVCASVAYGSLAVTDFRGFRHFGIIGGVGMLLAWFASYTVLPALLLLGERLVPTRQAALPWADRLYATFSWPFLKLAERFPRQLRTGATLVGASALAISVRYLSADPLEYDLGKMRNEATEPTSARVLARRVENSIDRLNRDGRALLTDRVDQVEPLVRALEQRRDAAPAGRKPFDRVVSVFDLLPEDQPEKIRLVSEIEDRVRRARKLHMIRDADWAKLEPELPTDLRPLGVGDLPSDVVWPFEESDGTRGRIVYLVPAVGRSLNDGRYLAEWADSFREVRLPNGEVVRGSGDPVLLADMIDNVRADSPKAMACSILGTSLVVLLAFRRRRAALLALASMLLGMSCLVALLAFMKMRINFLNFVALPISVGVGADYSVNVMKRLEVDANRDVVRTVRETGGAVVLCSLTTLLGYGALTWSVNGAVRSFGIAGVLGEATMLLSAMLVLPAILLKDRPAVRARSRAREESLVRAAGHAAVGAPARRAPLAQRRAAISSRPAK